MKPLQAGKRERNAGIALVYAVFGAFVAISMVTVMFTMAGVTRTKSEGKRSTIQAQYLADGAIEEIKLQMKVAKANWTLPELMQGWADQTELAEQNNDPDLFPTVDVAGTDVRFEVKQIAPSENVADAAGLETELTPYEVEAIAEVDNLQSRAGKVFYLETAPIFTYAVFYTNDLEIMPGPNMTLGGRVHTNGDMYLGCNNTLTMDTNYVRTAGNMYRKRKNNNESKGTVDIRKWVANPFDASEPSVFVTMNSESQMGSVTNVSGYDSNFTDGWDDNLDGDFNDASDWLPFLAGALDLWGEPTGYAESGHTVLTGGHGQQQAATPEIGSIKAFDETTGGAYAWDTTLEDYVNVGAGNGTHDKGYYHANAGLSIIVAENGSSFTAYDADGNVVPSIDLNGAVTLDDWYDARQANGSGAHTNMVHIDMDLLMNSNAWPSNGLLYSAHFGMGTGTDAKGTVLTNGAELASSLTVVTEGAAYVHGDYNTTDKKGAAVIADAVNLLSNSWDYTKAAGDLPVASDTTFNCAIVTGNYETEWGKYNGGLENLPRFHETWTGKKATINGSFVCAWESEYATGLWKYGSDRYTAPKRDWYYDTFFNDPSNLPPYYPQVVET
ncbi:MAG: hypothetical protein O2816_03580, partial [Planctomycetota bacterium]|nr:hypothetical protein [Planctomycetota bacterium]